MTAPKRATDHALAILFSQASGERVHAGDIRKHKLHGAEAEAIATMHEHTAERLNQLAAAAPRVWADADRLAAPAAHSAIEEL